MNPLQARRKGNLAPLQLLTDFVDVHEQQVTRAQPIGVYSFDDEWPSASTFGCARSIDDHDDLFAAVEGVHLEFNVAAVWRKGNSKNPLNSLIRERFGVAPDATASCAVCLLMIYVSRASTHKFIAVAVERATICTASYPRAAWTTASRSRVGRATNSAGQAPRAVAGIRAASGDSNIEVAKLSKAARYLKLRIRLMFSAGNGEHVCAGRSPEPPPIRSGPLSASETS